MLKREIDKKKRGETKIRYYTEIESFSAAALFVIYFSSLYATLCPRIHSFFLFEKLDLLAMHNTDLFIRHSQN